MATSKLEESHRDWVFNSKFYAPLTSGLFSKFVCFGELSADEVNVSLNIAVTLNSGLSYTDVYDSSTGTDRLYEEIIVDPIDQGNAAGFRITIGTDYILEDTKQLAFTENLTGSSKPGTSILVYDSISDILISQAVADSRGRFSIDIPPGSYDIKYVGNGYSQAEVQKTLSVGLPSKLHTGDSATFASFQTANEFLNQANTAASYHQIIFDTFIDDSKRLTPETSEYLAFSRWGRCYKGETYVKNFAVLLGTPIDATFYTPSPSELNELDGEEIEE